MAKYSDAESYYRALPEERRARLEMIRQRFLAAVTGVEETFRYKMPTFEKDGNWVALGNQKHYVAVYFCSADLIAEIRVKNPKINCGTGCVRIRDNQEVPLAELERAFRKAMKMRKQK